MPKYNRLIIVVFIIALLAVSVFVYAKRSEIMADKNRQEGK